MHLADRRECSDSRGDAERGQQRNENGAGGHGDTPHPNWLVVQRNFLAVTDRFDFAIEPILLECERAPALGHASIASKCWLAPCTLGELKAVIGVFSKKIGLLHVN
ncbi:hypothetical protein S58_39760 [Bradyrhizobium oligotrophicum S58]|uniref:Uncharacterized protein n=1 Tax=Bradyrhizobium oligotrophicum S58 TaxID=1245469 RepID=M4Z958_9BRAD|nr:hypothetical protein S58_39760 [Bradyrhizobium oligotrophicum S58]